MSIIRVWIPGEPFALKRARAFNAGKFIRMYDPKENVSWKSFAAGWMLKARNEAGITLPFAGFVGLTITAYFSCPKSDERKRDQQKERWSCSKKDVDNILKAVGDAGNGVLWNDDKNIVIAMGAKRIAA